MRLRRALPSALAFLACAVAARSWEPSEAPFEPPRARACLRQDPPRRPASRRPLWGSASAQPLAVSPMAAMHSCLSCHDGAAASAGTSFAARGSHGAPGADGGHPVGVDYLAAAARRPGEYHDPGARPGMVLEGGKVTCLSCHSSRSPVRTWAPGAQSELCLTCHRQ